MASGKILTPLDLGPRVRSEKRLEIPIKIALRADLHIDDGGYLTERTSMSVPSLRGWNRKIRGSLGQIVQMYLTEVNISITLHR